MAAGAEITVEVPHVLRVYCGGARQLALNAANIREALGELERLYPELYCNICDETGVVRRHVNLFVNSAHMRDRDGMNSELKSGDVLIVLPAVSGG
jgi:adenylyltransferase/sulfurtransferase